MINLHHFRNGKLYSRLSLILWGKDYVDINCILLNCTCVVTLRNIHSYIHVVRGRVFLLNYFRVKSDTKRITGDVVTN